MTTIITPRAESAGETPRGKVQLKNHTIMETITVVHVAENNPKSAMLIAHVPIKVKSGRTVFNKLEGWMESDKAWKVGEKISAPKGMKFILEDRTWILAAE